LSRNNELRTGSNKASDSPAAAEAAAPAEEGSFKSPLDFVTPTNFVSLPSKGKGYPSNHPLYGKEVIEIKFMTAKEEDILTSRALLKKNLAIERFLQSVILDRSVNVKDMLIGDRNAVLVAARASGYGEDYESSVMCPNCSTKSSLTFDLANPKIHEGSLPSFAEVEETPNGTFIIELPASNFKAEIRLMTGEDENYIAHMLQSSKKNNSEQYKRMIVAIEGFSDKKVVNHFIKNGPSKDLRLIRSVYKHISPDVQVVADFCCPSCGHEQELEVSFGADFFWPDG
jgi:rubredoxin